MLIIKTLLSELFYASSLALLVLAMAEFLWPFFVQAYLNMSLYLFFWLLIAIINVVLANYSSEANGK